MESSKIQSNQTKNKQFAILGALLVFTLSNFAFVWFENNASLEPIISIASVIGLGFCILLWCKLDSIERNQSLSAVFRVCLVLFGIFALVVYLFKTRGFKGGLIAFGYFLIIVIGFAIVSTLINAAALMVLDKS